MTEVRESDGYVLARQWMTYDQVTALKRGLELLSEVKVFSVTLEVITEGKPVVRKP